MPHKKHFLGLCLLFVPLLVLINSCSDRLPEYKTVKFEIILAKPIISQNVYLTGNNEKLGNWAPAGILLEKKSDTIWTKSFLFNINENIEFKVTKGSFKLQATNSDGWIYDNFKLTVKNDTSVKINIPNWAENFYSRRINKSYFTGQDAGVKLVNNWRYHSGDNVAWANIRAHDSSWETVSSDLTQDNLPKEGWNNIGWFRTHLEIDSSLYNTSFAYLVSQFGALEIYLNGRLLHKFGNIGECYKNYFPVQNRNWYEIKFDSQKDQIVAVRYANYSD
jgi:hypothetical protein